MSEAILTNIARNVLASFLLSLGLQPSEGEDTLEVRDFGPHRVFTQQARVPDEANAINPNNILALLVDYLEQRKALYPGPIFEPHDVALYKCPLGSGNYIYISVSHTAA